MITIKGKWYDGKTSAQIGVVMQVDDGDAVHVVRGDDGRTIHRQKRFEARVSDRLGDTARLLRFPNGAVLETDDNAGIDQILGQTRRDHWSLWVHILESRKRYVLAAFVIVLLVGAGMVRFGFPAAAKLVAAALPDSIYDMADRQTLAFLDKALFEESALPPETERRVRSHLSAIMAAHGEPGVALQFRKGGKLGPNAFALPGGTIVFTDEMVATARHDDELLAVMAHEIGHVVHRHGMRRMIQDSLLSFAILALTGDASGVSELFLGLPVILTELAYSRAFERDADRYALAYLIHNEIPPERFADILARIDQLHRDQPSGKGEGWTGYLATHPPTSERLRIFRGE